MPVMPISHAGYRVRLRSGSWDMGIPFALKDVCLVHGALNGGENCTATMRLYRNDSVVAEAVEDFEADAVRTVSRDVRLDCERIAYEMDYSDRDGPAQFGGLTMEVARRGDVI